MPRRPRVLIEGGIYHVYNRFARGADIFHKGEEAGRFLKLLREVKRRDDLAVYAWCLMSNHYHLSVRAGPIPLSRSIGSLQARFGQSYNRRWGSSGPRWQSRFKAQLVEDDQYLCQIVAYIHLNPVTAYLVGDPGDYRWSGHRELLGEVVSPLIDADQVLGIYGNSLHEARKNYLAALNATRNAPWNARLPGNLPWWRYQPDRPLEPPSPDAWIDHRGVSTGRQRPRLSPEDFVHTACRSMGSDVRDLSTDGLSRETSQLRILLVTLGVERWHQRPRELGRLLGRRADVVSRWVCWGAARRQRDREFALAYDHLDFVLSSVNKRLQQ